MVVTINSMNKKPTAFKKFPPTNIMIVYVNIGYSITKSLTISSLTLTLIYTPLKILRFNMVPQASFKQIDIRCPERTTEIRKI